LRREESGWQEEKMRRLAFGAAIVVLVVAAAFAQQPVGTRGAGSPAALTLTPADLSWSAAPDALPPGAQMAVIDGDPGSSGPFVIRLKVPDGYTVPPHWHPTDESVTVIEGTFLVGMGDQFSESSLKSLGAGSFAKMPQRMNHYASVQGATTIQIEGMGPFAITYVNASDDPRNKK
jgi:hypothetical protein